LRQIKKGCDFSQPSVFVVYSVNTELTLGELENSNNYFELMSYCRNL